MRSHVAGLACIAMLLAMHAVPACAAALPNWLKPKRASEVPLVTETGAPIVALAPDEEVRAQLDGDSAMARIDGQNVRYARFMLPKTMPHARIEVSITTQRNSSGPRFTVLAPQFVLLDRNGQIVSTVRLAPLALDIEPFRRTRLSGCVIAENFAGFLLASDPSRVGKLYEFDARPRSGAPDRGFTSRSSINVYMRYADQGEVLLRVVPDAGDDASCAHAAS